MKAHVRRQRRRGRPWRTCNGSEETHMATLWMRRGGAIAVLAVTLVTSSGRAAADCVGDCNGDDTVAINELISGVAVSLGAQPMAACPAFDADGNGAVTINELV